MATPATKGIQFIESTLGIENVIFIYSNNCSYENSLISGSVEKLCGYSLEEIKKLPAGLLSIVHKDDIPEIRRKIADFESDPESLSMEQVLRIDAKSGETIWLKELITVVRDKKSQVTCSKRILFDVSDFISKEIENQQTTSILKEQISSKDKFISIISHDLKSPFTTLLGFSEILVNEKDLTAEEQVEYLTYIYEASQTQLQLINYLLDWSRLQTGRIKVEPARVNARFLISNATAMLTGEAMRKDIDIRMDVSGDIYIQADDKMMTTVIKNLLSNAIKYSHPGKPVHISSAKFKEGMIEIVVRDEGVGIAEENHSKLFRIDEKFALPGTKGEKGSGLGLTLVHEIVEKHKGNIWFYSSPDQGSEFHITLPEAKNIVLLVEDDIAIRALYKRIIRGTLKNFEIVEADNGYQAISMMQDIVPSIVIADHDMPLMNGIQLIEAMRKKESSRNIPVIVISAKLDEEIAVLYKKLGATQILSKPIETEKLISVINETLV